MNILFITQDSMSQFTPLIKLGQYYNEKGYKVCFATGNRLKKEVEKYEFFFTKLLLEEEIEAENNDISILPEDISFYLDKTRQGMTSILIHQSFERQKYFLWNPQLVIQQIDRITKKINPKIIISVNLAYNSTLALKALKLPFISFVTGHPMELPSVNEIQGFQYYYPNWVSKKNLPTLKQACIKAQTKFTDEYNKILQSYNPKAKLELNAFTASSENLIIFNYPKNILNKNRDFKHAKTLYINSSVRSSILTNDLIEWLQKRDKSKPTLLVTLGTINWNRQDVLINISKTLRNKNYNVIFSLGGNPLKILDPIPNNWFVKRYVPQTAVLQHCDLIIFHGGNNSFTEAISFGVPLLAGPLSSDQFYIAADIERMGLGLSFNPNSIKENDFIEKITHAIKCKYNCQKTKKALDTHPIGKNIIEIIRSNLIC